MGRLWRTTSSGKRVRTAVGVRHELAVVVFESNSLFERRKIFGLFSFVGASAIWPSSISPRRGVSALDKADIFFARLPISAYCVFRVVRVAFWSHEPKIFSSVVKPISIYMVYKNPSGSRSPNYIVMNKVRLKASIPIVALIKPLSFIKLFPNIDVYLCVTNQFIFIIMQRSFNIPIVNNSFTEYPLFCYRGQDDLAVRDSSLASSACLPCFNFVLIWHNWSIPRIKKFHNIKEVFYG